MMARHTDPEALAGRASGVWDRYRSLLRLVPPRSHAPEILDRSDNAEEDVAGALRDIRAVNRWLGGRRALRLAVRPFVDRPPAGVPIEVLDVGAGAADMAVALVRDARRAGRQVRVTTIDLDRSAAAIAARATAGYPEIRVVRADAFALPFRPGSFDVVCASMFLHHFRHEEIVPLLSALRSLARGAVVINDLRRHVVPWLLIGLLARVTLRHRMFVHDAPLSVLRGFTADELLRAGREAGAPAIDVRRRWACRLVLTLPGMDAR